MTTTGITTIKTTVKSIKRFRGRTPYTSYLACTADPLKPIRCDNGRPAEFLTEAEAEAFAADWAEKQARPTIGIVWYRPAEQMPESEHTVMFTDGRHVYVGRHYSGRYWFDALSNDSWISDVTLWAELPQVPSEVIDTAPRQ